MSAIKRALLSVTDKEGIIPLANGLIEAGYEIYASGGTQSVLAEAGISCQSVQELSGAPEAFQGRMKTLAFPIFSGILYQRASDADLQDVSKLKIPSIDVVCVNFYAFEASPGIEKIDIGGPSLVRAAAKNYKDVIVLTDPSQYSVFLVKQKAGTLDLEFRRGLASQAFQKVLQYDRAIAEWFQFESDSELKYGENPHQGARFFPSVGPEKCFQPQSDIPLSYNNILDLTAGYDLCAGLTTLFPSSKIAVVVKHQNPCGVAVFPEATRATDVLEAAWKGDSKSAFGGVWITNFGWDVEEAEWLRSRFYEGVAAPSFSPASSSHFKVKAKKIVLNDLKPREVHRISTLGGDLVQAMDPPVREELRVVTKAPFSDQKLALAQFVIEVTKHLKSNAIGIAAESATGFVLLGAGQGQPNRVDALERLALPRALDSLKGYGLSDLSNAVLASDAFFPFSDWVEPVRKSGLRFIVQPGGSIRDAESVTACDEAGLAMAMTGKRHFKH